MDVQIINGRRFFNGTPLIPSDSLEAWWFEEIDQVAVMAWFRRRWSDSIFWCIGYLLAIFIGQVNRTGSTA